MLHKFSISIFLLFSLISSAFAQEKQAILIVSFGTSMPEARKAINNLFESTRENFKGYEIRLSFTSNIIRKKILREQNINIPTPVQALADLNNEGFKNVYVMPTHLIPGEEFDEIKNVVSAFKILTGKYGFNKLILGRPFLNNYEDCERMAKILASRFAEYINDNNTGIILMGHGTPEHVANALYSLLQFALDKNYKNKFFLGTVEAAPKIEDVILKLKANPEIKNLIISPLMIVAGDHANNDLAGEDDPESWLNILKSNGYENITKYLKGLGEDENFTKDFIKRINEMF